MVFNNSRLPSSPPQISPRRALDFANEALDSAYSKFANPVLRLLVSQLDNPVLNKLWDEAESKISVWQNGGADFNPALAHANMKNAIRALTDAIGERLPVVEQAGKRAAIALEADAISLADQAILTESFGTTDPKQLKQIGVSWNHIDPRTLKGLQETLDNPELDKRIKGITPQIKDRIFAGIFEGQGPLQTARQLRKDLPQMAAYEINRIMRTTQLTAYRRATAEQQTKNKHLFAYQIRIEARDDRCCLACWALHGKKYPVGDLIIEHEQGRGRGVAIPVGSNVTIPTGPELWDQLPADRRRAIAGAAAFNAMEKGEARLLDFVEYDRDPLFGEVLREKSVKTLFGEETAKKFYAVNQGREGFEFTPYRGTLDGAANNIEVAQWFRRHYPNLEYQIGVDMPADSVKAAVKEFDRLATKFPQVAATMRGLATDDRGGFFGHEGDTWLAYASSAANRSPRNGWIVYNSKQFVKGDQAAPAGYGQWTIDDRTRWQGVTTHEFGHHVHYWLESERRKYIVPIKSLSSNFGEVGSTLNAWLGKWIPRASSLSQYGLTNKYEIFAESFSSMQHIPRAKWSAHTKRFAKMFDYITDVNNMTDSAIWIDDLARQYPDQLEAAKALLKELQRDVFELEDGDL